MFLEKHREAFLKYVSRQPEGCWLWTGARNSKGYGAFGAGGRTYVASRASWMLFKGAIPAGLFVCHRCDIPACVNPDHLFLGTPRDNTEDMRTKGRGSPNASPKLTAEQVKAIIASRERNKILADRYGVSNNAIWQIRLGITYRHITGGVCRAYF